ncbi:MAG: DNA repair protein RadA, partial [Aquificota bacterium]
MKEKTAYVCQECGYTSVRWVGRCPACGSWNSMVEEKEKTSLRVVSKNAKPKPLDRCQEGEFTRLSTGFKSLDQALGGGIVRGQVVLLAGEPGIGKSTLLSQVGSFFSLMYGSVLYVSGEESEYQVSLRAKRLGLRTSRFYITSETNLESLLELLREESYSLVIVDSIQTLFSSSLESSPGSVSQVRECAFRLAQACKELNIPLFLVGQVNKEGVVAGPKVLEHLVDTLLHFEGERFSFHRVVKVVKNRFGASSTIAVFKMTSAGLEEVPEPSAFFLQERVVMPG